MKKLFVIMLLSFAVCIGATSQTKAATIAVGSSFSDLSFAAKDSIAAGQTTYTITWTAGQHFKTTQDLLVTLDSISGPKMSVQLSGAKFSTTAYSNIGNAVVWSGTTADTSIIISNTTANRYRYYKVVVTRVAGKAALTDAQLKLYFE